jgi:cytochrome b561
MADNISKPRSQTKIKLLIDLGIFVGFLITMEPHASGLTIHEWLATSLIAVLIVHLLLSWDWIVQITRRFFSRMNRQSRINYILNWLLFIDGTVIMLSGFMISESLMPALGLQLPHNFAWRSLHDLSANLFLVLLGLHTALHWNWIVDTFKRYVFQPIGKLFSRRSRKDIPA